MAQFYTNFHPWSPTVATVQLAANGWDRYGRVDDGTAVHRIQNTVNAVSGVPGVLRRATTTGHIHWLTRDAEWPDPVADVQMFVRCRIARNGYHSLMARAVKAHQELATDPLTAYMLQVSHVSDDLRFLRYDNTPSNTSTSGSIRVGNLTRTPRFTTDYFALFEVSGATLRAKAWQVADPEPDWQLEWTDPSPLAAGAFGYGHTGSFDTEADVLAFGTGGDVAPRTGAMPIEVQPKVKVGPVQGSGDFADSAQVWLHPTNRSQSVILGTSKEASTSRGGVYVWDLDGVQLQQVPYRRPNNIDIGYNFPLGAGTIDLIGTSRQTDSIGVQFLTINPTTRALSTLAWHGRNSATAIPEGYALVHHRATGRWYSLFSSIEGVEQWELDGSTGTLVATYLRTLTIPASGDVEGLAVDAVNGYIWVTREDFGLYRYDLDPASSGDPWTLTTVGTHPGVAADIEGLTIYRASATDGYLLASSQALSTYVVYDRKPPHTYRGWFRIVANPTLGISAVANTDDISVTNRDLNASFPAGAFVVHDGVVRAPNTATDYKLVPWDDIAAAWRPVTTVHPVPSDPLVVNSAYDSDRDDNVPSGEWGELTQFTGTGQQHLDNTVEPGKWYRYRVSVENEDGTITSEYTDWMQVQAATAGLPISASGQSTTNGQANIQRTTAITASGLTLSTGSAAITRATTLSASGASATSGSADITRSAALSASGGSLSSGSASVGARLPVTASGASTSSGSAALEGSVGLSATGLSQTNGVASITRTTAVSATGLTTSSGSAAVEQRMTATASGLSVSSGTASITRTTTLSANGASQSSGSAVLQRTHALNATGLSTSSGTAGFAGSNTISATGNSTSSGTASIHRTTTITASGASISSGSMSVTRTTTMSATGISTTSGTASTRASLAVSATGLSSSGGTTSVTATTTITASGSSTSDGVAAFVPLEGPRDLVVRIDQPTLRVRFVIEPPIARERYAIEAALSRWGDVDEPVLRSKHSYTPPEARASFSVAAPESRWGTVDEPTDRDRWVVEEPVLDRS
jgi:myo-inositol-hexaphosphate 3-phosphohydrolase